MNPAVIISFMHFILTMTAPLNVETNVSENELNHSVVGHQDNDRVLRFCGDGQPYLVIIRTFDDPVGDRNFVAIWIKSYLESKFVVRSLMRNATGYVLNGNIPNDVINSMVDESITVEYPETDFPLHMVVQSILPFVDAYY